MFLCLLWLRRVIWLILQPQEPGLNPVPSCRIYDGQNDPGTDFYSGTSRFLTLCHSFNSVYSLPHLLIHSFIHIFFRSFIHLTSALYNLYKTRFKNRSCIVILSLFLSVTTNLTKDNRTQYWTVLCNNFWSTEAFQI